ncbi:MAG: hypothetical protein AAGJ73_12175 [Pseudomonadota bacterium]
MKNRSLILAAIVPLIFPPSAFASPEPSQRPGAAVGNEPIMIIFSVKDKRSGTGVRRASVECHSGAGKMRRKTDRMGIATVPVKAWSKRPVGRGSIRCFILKDGYSPEFRTVGLTAALGARIIEVPLSVR